MRLTLVSQTLEGHRREYVALMERLAQSHGIESRLTSHWRDTLMDADPVLFLMVEEDFAGWVAAALIRAAAGRRTVGLLFRGREAAGGTSLRLRVKRAVLTRLKAIPVIATLSIVPFSVEPRLADVADDWIDDPQLWDIDDTTPRGTPLSDGIRGTAAGRHMVVSLGGQNKDKGFQFFTQAWRDDPAVRDSWLFVAAGKVADAEAEAAARFEAEGGMVIDRFISDEELASLYGVADVVWGVYAPTYDQASGIFGRAVQYDVPILLRRGSAIEAHGRQLGARAVAIDYGNVAQVGAALEAAARTAPADPALRHGMRARNLATLFTALTGRS